MRAILCNAFKGIEALGFTEVDEPRPAANEVLVDVHAASVSYMDYLMSCGGYQMRPALPYVPGTDAAGIVLGTRVPIILTSRADSLPTRLASCAVAVMVAVARRAQEMALAKSAGMTAAV